MSYLSPGVYVQELPSTIKPIAGVSTSTAGFVGIVPDTLDLPAKALYQPGPVWLQQKVAAPAKVAQLITSWGGFTRAFGDLLAEPLEAKPQKDKADAVPSSTEAIEATVNLRKVTLSKSGTDTARDAGHVALAHAVFGFFANGGSRCFVVRVTAGDDFAAALSALAAIDEIALVAAPGVTDKRPEIAEHCRATLRFGILDPEEAETPSARPELTKTDSAAYYLPRIVVFDAGQKLIAPEGQGLVDVAPSGHIAGVYARVDMERGVHKAPGNEIIAGARGVAFGISRAEQDGLNPKGINCLRVFDGNVTIWGARTVGGNDNADLKYISVRRTLLFLRRSIEQGTRWAVFEPNDAALWQKIARNVTAFLTNVWRSGALFGATPAEAFYVRCDGETNPPDLRELGQVVTEIGVAIVRPAEFVIFRISQSSPAA